MSSENEMKSLNTQKIKMLLWSVFAGSKGCNNRVKVVIELKRLPLNTNQLSQKLKLDYKVVERHLEILENHELVLKVGNKYGVTYFLSPLLESNMNLFDEVKGKAKNCDDN